MQIFCGSQRIARNESIASKISDKRNSKPKNPNQVTPQMKSTPPGHRTRLFVKHIVIGAFLALTAPSVLKAQQTVFNDAFTSSTLNGGPTTNMIPGGTPTASFTSYEIGSGKNATASTNSPSGH